MRVQDSYRIVGSVFTQAFASVNLTGTYVQVTAGLTEDIDAIYYSCSVGSGTTVPVAIGTGAAASEVVQAYIHPFQSGVIPIKFGANTRIAIASASGTINTGFINILLLKKI